ncbi:MAG: NADH-quinone oxidoreductase subunit L [Gemmataceae bacterium]|nr:NADH-quinone oxidoreductase subunit L [Gemmataceae bacterium]
MSQYLWLIPFLPLLGSAIIAGMGKNVLRGASHWPCILGAVGSCVLSVMTFMAVQAHEIPLLDEYVWFRTGSVGDPASVQVAFSLRADGLTAVMLITVTFIGTLIAIYSSSYMKGDPAYYRFFMAVSLFLAAMTGLVLANNFILLYACWEGVGLCSYLLVGFWFFKPSAAAAARKAFLVTRLGDIGLFLGILILWSQYGTLDYQGIFQHASANDPYLGIACFLLFVGAVGKSAQFPLHVWLPDAMEGPSPVSALIHAATMVTAGVYLLARTMPLFGLCPDVQAYVAVTGAFTALLAALIALTQTDLKRVLAYSTVSQLGYMFLALGSGVQHERLATLAVVAAVFHLFTHAFFKALLFLGAGSVMHAMGDVIDMRKFSGLRRVLPTTHWTFLIGSAALAGFPLLSGFWSKDEVLLTTLRASQNGPYATLYMVCFISAMATAGLTAFYTFRAYFMTFWGPEKIPAEAYAHHGHSHAELPEKPHGHADHGHAHGGHGDSGHGDAGHGDAGHGAVRLESGEVMLWPLRILAIGALLVGIVLGPTHLFAHFLERNWVNTPDGFPVSMRTDEAPHPNLILMIGSGIFALAGIGLAYLAYVKNPKMPAEMMNSAKRMYGLSRNKFYLDEIFAAVFVRPLQAFAHLCRVIDQMVVDGVVDLVGQFPSMIGAAIRPVQNGLVQFYALLMALGVAGYLLAVLVR